MMYNARGLQQVFDGRTVLDIDTLAVDEGKICALVGPNGAGKSTLLEILAFLELPHAGELFFRGQRLGLEIGGRSRLRREVVLVNQHPVLFSTSVLANVAYGLRIRGVTRNARHTRAMEALTQVGLPHLARRPAARLSGGETQRVAIARALATQPAVLLCDEPTASVDRDSRGAIIELLHKINREQSVTIVLATHDRMLARELADQTLWLEAGRIRPAQSGQLRLQATPAGNGMLELRLSPKTILTLGCPVNAPVQVTLDLNRLRIVDGGDTALPLDWQRFPARVFKVSATAEAVELTVEAGARLALHLSLEHGRRLRPMVGDWVEVAVPPEALCIDRTAG